jgi:hypothetical protein
MLEKAVLQRTCEKRAAYSGDMQCYCVYVVVFPSRAHVVGDCQDCVGDARLKSVQCWAESVGVRKEVVVRAMTATLLIFVVVVDTIIWTFE